VKLIQPLASWAIWKTFPSWIQEPVQERCQSGVAEFDEPGCRPQVWLHAFYWQGITSYSLTLLVGWQEGHPACKKAE